MWSTKLSKGKETSKIRQRVNEWTSGKGLDVGCGFDKIHPEAIGIDLVPLPGVDYLLDARDLYIFEDNHFDYVFSSHTLEDLEDTKDTLCEWLRVLKTGGYLILYLPHKNFYPNKNTAGSNPAHKHDFLPKDILEILKQICLFDVHILEERNQADEYSFLIAAKITGKR